MDDKLPHVETDLSEHVSAAPEHAKAAKPHVAQTYWYYASLTHTHAVPPPNEVFVKAATLHDAQIAAADMMGVVWDKVEGHVKSVADFQCVQLTTPPTLAKLLAYGHYDAATANKLLAN